jgi:hypothetical protein
MTMQQKVDFKVFKAEVDKSLDEIRSIAASGRENIVDHITVRIDEVKTKLAQLASEVSTKLETQPPPTEPPAPA